MYIGVILVTFNRLDKLKIALDAYEKQKLKPVYIIVVNNCSTDGTKQYLEEWKKERSTIKRYVVTMNKNEGGAGGFYTGLEYGMNLDSDWLWVADDDAFPKDDALNNLKLYYDSISYEEKIGISTLCGSVINKGKIHVEHRNHLKITPLKVKIIPSSIEEYKKRAFDIDIFSYVGTALKKEALKNAGLTEKDYFIYCDDQEHSIRMRKEGKIVCVPSCQIIHDTPGFKNKKLFWGNYYHYRNDLLMRKKHFYSRFWMRWVKGYYRNVIKSNNVSNTERELRKAAYIDAMKGKKGLHSIYKPGWNPID